MLTICIPVFNVDVQKLVQELARQANSCDNKVEILLIDDCSTLYKGENRELNKVAKIIELPQNVGRAKIRNLFLQHSSEEYLLFLDCDVVITDPNFVAHYLLYLAKKPSIVCGGHYYTPTQPKKSEYLRWKYGVYKESKSAEERKKLPNKSFMTNNFVIKRSILEAIRFDERLTNYGHEDTLFGLQLKRNHYEIHHIENKVMIGDQEKNEIFLQKTEQGVKNLVQILQLLEYQNELWNEVALLQFYRKVQKWRFLLLPLFRLVKPVQTYLLRKGVVNLISFDFFKLGILMQTLKSVH